MYMYMYMHQVYVYSHTWHNHLPHQTQHTPSGPATHLAAVVEALVVARREPSGVLISRPPSRPPSLAGPRSEFVVGGAGVASAGLEKSIPCERERGDTCQHSSSKCGIQRNLYYRYMQTEL